MIWSWKSPFKLQELTSEERDALENVVNTEEKKGEYETLGLEITSSEVLNPDYIQFENVALQ